MELAYSGLHQLCGTILDQLQRLPDPQRLTLEVVFGLTAGAAPDPFLVAFGLSNSEIGTQLFLSPRTVEWHLSKVFGKLGISSRKELRSALSDVGAVIAAV